MKKKLFICLCVVIAICVAVLTIFLLTSEGPLEIYAADGKLLARLDKTSIHEPGTWPEDCRAYIDVAITQAAQLLMEEKDCTEDEAKTLLASRGYRLDTAFDSAVQAAVAAAYATYNEQELEMGCAVTDLNGKLLAVFSSHADRNYATAQTPPYSSFKPLSVYAPALEADLIHFSSVFEDSPVTRVEGKPWPSNATKRYTNAPVTVAQAVRQSLNTVAVRCMDTVRLEHSFAFLEERFGLELTGEKARAESLGQSEVRGNVALGHLDYGVAPVEMAGYFQCFGNGGSYTPPQAVTALSTSSGKTLYTFSYEPTRVLTEENAAVMNRLLQQVTAPGGTGSAAFDPDKPTAGKTGTGKLGNWFVGVTPGYSCAVWHGNQPEGNIAAAIFSEARKGFPATETDSFPVAEGMAEILYCTESGLEATSGCPNTGIGIYASEKELPACNMHN